MKNCATTFLLVSLGLLVAGCGNKGGDAPPPPPAPAAPELEPVEHATAAKPGACSIAGAWTNRATPPVVLTFNADGTGATETGVARDDLAWKMVDDEVFSFHGTKVKEGGKLSCQPTQEGKYKLRFAPDCNKVTAVLNEDQCTGRAKAMNGMTVKRK